MKKLLFTLFFITMSNLSYCCQVVLTNNTKDAIITIFDRRSQQSVTIKEGQAVKANSDPDQHARLTVTIKNPNRSQSSFNLEQFACSKSHEIPITSQEILYGLQKKPNHMDVDKLIKWQRITQSPNTQIVASRALYLKQLNRDIDKLSKTVDHALQKKAALHDALHRKRLDTVIANQRRIRDTLVEQRVHIERKNYHELKDI